MERFQPAGRQGDRGAEASVAAGAARLGRGAAEEDGSEFPPLLYEERRGQWSRSCDWLQRRLGLDDAGLRKIVVRLPKLLIYSVEDNLEPKLEWLQTRLDLDAVQLKYVVVTLPQLLSLSGGLRRSWF